MQTLPLPHLLPLPPQQNIGVRPETALAKACGLELGKRGGIKVDNGMRTR
jgi:NADPH-dependent 2,4-dienoyl-CoA reductase/sulfur reductase-like enzyme